MPAEPGLDLLFLLEFDEIGLFVGVTGFSNDLLLQEVSKGFDCVVKGSADGPVRDALF